MIFNTFTIFYLQMWRVLCLPPILRSHSMKRWNDPGLASLPRNSLASPQPNGGFPLEKGERKAVFNLLSSQGFLQISHSKPPLGLEIAYSI